MLWLTSSNKWRYSCCANIFSNFLVNSFRKVLRLLVLMPVAKMRGVFFPQPTFLRKKDWSAVKQTNLTFYMVCSVQYCFVPMYYYQYHHDHADLISNTNSHRFKQCPIRPCYSPNQCSFLNYGMYTPEKHIYMSFMKLKSYL